MLIILVLSEAINSPKNSYSPLRALRQILHQRLRKQLLEYDKDASLRSGNRGIAARKVLIAFEKKVAESAKRYVWVEDPLKNNLMQNRVAKTDEEINEDMRKEETYAASDLLAELQSQIEPVRIREMEAKARAILSGLGFAKAFLTKPFSTLSGGWKMRTSLAICLLQPSDILILDEPTNFLDLLGIIWLQRHLIRLRELDDPKPPTIILVSHDRDFINTVCQELVILRDRILTNFKGDLNVYESSTRDKKLYLTRMRDAQDKQKAHMQQTIRQNIKQGKAAGDENKLRQAKSRQLRLDDRMGMQKNEKGGRFKLSRDLTELNGTSRMTIKIPADEKDVSMVLPDAPDLRFPGPLISLEKVSFRYPTPKTLLSAPPVVRDIDLTIYMGDRVGLVGLNGCGKSTLIRLITNVTEPSTGIATRHPRLRMGYYSQHAVEELRTLGCTEVELTALALITRDVESKLDEGELRALLGSLGLPGRTASDVPLNQLSGGQLVRLALARLLWKNPQLLVLDEITTHLDFYTITALASALSNWNGAILVASHDRYLIRRVVEGEKDELAQEEGESEDDVEALRRRTVFLLSGGALEILKSGVKEFEKSFEKRIAKLINS